MTLAMHDFSIAVSMHDEAVLKNEKRGMWMRWENQYDPWNTLNQLKITK